MTVIIDRRWEGPHGIGRFAREVAARIPHQPLPLTGKPLHPLDPLRLNWKLRRHSKTSFFTPGFNPPWGKPCRFYFTIHDLIHLEIREESSAAKRAFYELIIRPALRNAEAVFTVSEFSKARIVDWGKVSPEKIIVAGNGVSPIFCPEGDRWKGTDRPYFLYVGNHKPHKNIQGLIEAFGRSGLQHEMDLLITGSPTSCLKNLITAFHLEDFVKFLGVVDEPCLASLYRGTRGLILPSWYEGFGLPLAEAMASGAPVLASNRASLPEIGGQAARYFDPGDIESLIAGLGELAQPEASLPFRAAGLERARLFCWNQVSQIIHQTILT